jgi:hypothetical protein
MSIYKKIIYSFGDYEGEIEDGLPNGNGFIKFSSGSTYHGIFRSGVFHGQGTTISSDGNIKAQGYFEDGKKNGPFIIENKSHRDQVTVFYDNDNMSKDEFRLSNPEASIESYIKDIVEHYDDIGRYSASAFMEMKVEGNTYKGQCKALDDGMFLPHGLGTATYNYPPEYLSKLDSDTIFKNTQHIQNSIYAGEWNQGNREGHGSIKSPNGAGYTGYWKENLWHGKGKQVMALRDTVSITDGEWNMNELIYGTKQTEVEKIVLNNAMDLDELPENPDNEFFDQPAENLSNYYFPEFQAKSCLSLLPVKIQKRIVSNNGQIFLGASKIDWANFKSGLNRLLEKAEYLTNIIIKSKFNNDVPMGIGEVIVIGLLHLSIFQYDFDKNELIEEETYFDINNKDIDWDTSHVADFPDIGNMMFDGDVKKMWNTVNNQLGIVTPKKGHRYLSDKIGLIKDKYLLDDNI